jgi:hypothetical protein
MDRWEGLSVEITDWDEICQMCALTLKYDLCLLLHSEEDKSIFMS